MNYFAHGMRFTDRPYFLAGTALPDWLSVADRRVRLRARRVEPFADGSNTPEAELAAGILQHFHDDDWFHRTRSFFEVSSELTRRFRAALPPDDAHRPSFLGHIVTEILLDGTLIARSPRTLEAYYAAFQTVDAAVVEQAVNRMARNSTDRITWLIPLFLRERFLADYLDSRRLLLRLNQIMRRVKLGPLPDDVLSVLDAAREIVETNSAGLLSGLDAHSILQQ